MTPSTIELTQETVVPASAPKPYYELDGITIYHGDCREILPGLEPVDLLLTDPPYGIGVVNSGKIGSNNLGVVKDYGSSDWDKEAAPLPLLDLAIEKSERSILWGGNYFELPASSCWLVWDKDNSADFADCELAWTNMKKAVRLFKWRWNGMIQERSGNRKEHRFHPTQKPLPLMQWCIKQAGDVASLVDPFMGSGTTLLAAKLDGVDAIGIEIEERYCEIAAERLRQGVLF